MTDNPLYAIYKNELMQWFWGDIKAGWPDTDGMMYNDIRMYWQEKNLYIGVIDTDIHSGILPIVCLMQTAMHNVMLKFYFHENDNWITMLLSHHYEVAALLDNIRTTVSEGCVV